MAFPRFEPVPDSGPAPLFTDENAPDAPPSDGRSTAGSVPGSHSTGPRVFPPDPAPEATALLDAFTAVLALAGTVPTDVTVFDKVNDHTVETLHGHAGDLVRLAALFFSLTAGQIQRRSAPSLGKDGMARKSGHRTPEEMTTNVGGVNKQDAVKALRDGKLIHTTQSTDNAEKTGTDPIDPLTHEPIVIEEPWLIGVGRARTQGMSRECADAIRRGLGTPTEDVTVEMLRTAADHLCTEAEQLGPDRLLLRAQRLRDDLDKAGIGLREEERHQKRSLKITRRSDGMTQLVLLLDTENAARVVAILDNATSPKLGGPRTAPGAQAEQAQKMLDDTRTPGQLALDTFVHLLTAGANADDSELLGTGAPSVRVLTTAPIPGHPAPAVSNKSAADPTTNGLSADAPCDCDGDCSDQLEEDAARDGDDYETVEVKCQTGRPHKHTRRRKKHPSQQPPLNGAPVQVIPAEELYGPGWIEGQGAPVSADTIARMACAGSTTTITFDSTGQPIDVSSEQRLFAHKQRVALAARDGGCMWTDVTGTSTCNRPPSWTEAHHVEHWDRDGGKTTIVNGILLCRYHHLTLHNDGWEIYRVESRYWLVPPAAVDPEQTPRLIKSRSDAYAQLDHLVHGTSPTASTPTPDTTTATATAGETHPAPTDDRSSSTHPSATPQPKQNNATWADSADDDASEHMTSNGTAYRFVPRRNGSRRTTDTGPGDPAPDTDPTNPVPG